MPDDLILSSVLVMIFRIRSHPQFIEANKKLLVDLKVMSNDTGGGV